VSELVILVFSERYRAPNVLNELRQGDGAWAEILDTALAVTLDAQAKASAQINVDLSKRRAVGWARLWGALLKVTFFVPITDGLVEAADRIACSPELAPAANGDEGWEISWWRRALGNSPNFRRDVSALCGPNSSAILMLLRNVEIPKALSHLCNYGNTILHTTIGAEQDRELLELLGRTYP